MEGPLEIKNTNISIEEPIKSEAPVQNSDNSERTDGAISPPPNCSICLGKLVNTSFTDSCLHQFCFTCLLQWSKIKTECPLCKQTFKSIIHNVRSEEDYDQYHVPRELVSQIPQPQVTATLDVNFDVDWNVVPRRFHYRTTMTRNRRLLNGGLLNPEQVTRREQLPSMAPQVPREERRRRRTNPTDYRHVVYRHGIWATPLPDVFGRFRECSPEYYRRQPQELNRLIPWLNRELQVLLNNEPTHIAYVLNVIIEALTQYDIRSPEFRTIVRPFFAIHTDHFAHEFLNFAQTNFDLVGYDQSVTYMPRGLSNEYATLIASPTIASSSVDTEISNTLPYPISMPGPSAVGHMFRRVETSNNIPELLILSSSSSESEGECEIIGYVKPRHERTPEIIELLSSDSEHVSVSHTSNGNAQSIVRIIHSENVSLPSTSRATKGSSLSSCSTTSSDSISDSDYTPRKNRRNHSKKSGKRTVAPKHKRSYGVRSRNKLSKKRKISSSSEWYFSSSESSLKKCNEKRLKKARYRIQAKGTGRIKLIKREESYSDEDSSNSDSSSTETDSKTKTKKCYREYKSKRDCPSSANDYVAKSGKITRNKEKTLSENSNMEKLKSKNKDSKCSENGQSRSRSNSTSSNASERDKRPSCRQHRESRNTNEFGSQDDSTSKNKDMSRNDYKFQSKKTIYYSSDSEDDHLRSSSQCSNYSNKSYSHWRKSKRKEKHKDKERHRSSSRIFNLSQSNASTILTMSISSKNDMYPTKHSDRNGSDCKEKHKSRKGKESKYRKSENEKKSRLKKKRRRILSSSSSE